MTTDGGPVTMYDRIERLGDTVYQHGPYNDRIYVMKTARRSSMPIISSSTMSAFFE